jgi:two-component system sensor histidine kinase/response regulator
MAFDRDELLDRLGGDAVLMQQMIDLFVDECPRLLDEMHAAIGRGDLDAVRRSAHAFRGAAANFSSGSAVAASLRLEEAAALGNAREAESALRDVHAEATRLLDELRDQ